ncbi:family 2 glycosyl transferase [Haladaptatus sp. W1]|uniref:glycosyltransferase family 2 protein n=1 Tax=Haladaptatus sp. W1 TaxID=1897478 RepID=UPI000849C969|nr:glycosyltransferase family A protein [Haladaptatus sp. W1]ODR82475.1 family 2 glycosyl transferase [Haladaptatus sp. W1]
MAIEHPITATDPRISVVVPTIPDNSHVEVVACLESQTFDSFEALVVNDASLDICEARNAGIEAANAPIVALTDDDCRPEEEWLSAIAHEFEAHPTLICLEGRVEGGRTYTGEQKYVGCNLAFDRDAALAVSGFDSEYAGWRDDTEFGWRMERDADGKCRYSDCVRMTHPEMPRATIDTTLEEQLKTTYTDRYNDVIVPNTIIGRINDWLWRNGVWEVVNAIRYRGQ